jgi:hypothetical protein
MPLHIQFIISSYIQRCPEEKGQETAKATAKDHKMEHLRIPKKTNQKPNCTGTESKSELSEAAKGFSST